LFAARGRIDPHAQFRYFQEFLKVPEHMNLPPLTQAFVLHFGEMGGRWGISRTVGQIYALLFLAELPLNADEITEKLGFSRSNVSMGLKELSSWRLVRLQHKPGDRREYFSTPEDIWEIVRILAEERRKREIDPTLSMLRHALVETPATPDERYAQARMAEMHDLMELVTRWSEDIQKLETETLVQLLEVGAKIQKVFQMKDQLKVMVGGGRRRAEGADDDV
jgi:DNA-binding transcriptional regulator GbsR (MarR family)